MAPWILTGVGNPQGSHFRSVGAHPLDLTAKAAPQCGRPPPGRVYPVDPQPQAPGPYAIMADHIPTLFGQVLREQRNTRGISQEALALSANVDRTFVSQMERGIRQPTLTTLCKLSEALDIQPSTLVARMEKLRR